MSAGCGLRRGSLGGVTGSLARAARRRCTFQGVDEVRRHVAGQLTTAVGLEGQYGVACTWTIGAIHGHGITQPLQFGLGHLDQHRVAVVAGHNGLAGTGPGAGIGSRRLSTLVDGLFGGIDRLVDLLVYFLVGLGFLLGDGYFDLFF